MQWDDAATQALQRAQEALKAAQNAYDAAVKAKAASDKKGRAGTESKPTPPEGEEGVAETKKFYPIDTGLGVYSDGTVGIYYSYQGKALGGFQDYADIIYPLNDPKSTNLLKDSQSRDILGWVSMAASAGFYTYYLVDVLNKADALFNAQSVGLNISADTPFLIAGNLFIFAGVIFFQDSHGNFDHAILRYN